MIVDASVVIDVVADPGPRGAAARAALAAADHLVAPGTRFLGHVRPGAAANQPNHPLRSADLDAALEAAEALEIVIEATHGLTCAERGTLRKVQFVTPTPFTSPPLDGAQPRC